MKTFCYLGLNSSRFSVNNITIEGLHSLGYTIIECEDGSKGLAKFFALYKKHTMLKNKYDVLVVGFPDHILVPFARLISRKPIVADLVGSLEDADYYSHDGGLWRRIKNKLIDRLAVHFADAVILESEAQKKRFEKRFGASHKYHVLYTGVANSFWQEPVRSTIHPRKVLFRGSLTPESGIMHILEAAKLLLPADISFKIIGRGKCALEVKEYIQKNNLENVEYIDSYLEIKALLSQMKECSLSLGQFESNPRLDVTIPHKLFESFALGIPYLSGDAPAVREIITDGVNGFLCPLANPNLLAQKIQLVLENQDVLKKVKDSAYDEFLKKYTSTLRAEKFLLIADSIV